MKKRICIDFDGVLNNYTGWTGTENLSTPQKGVEGFLCNLSKSYEIYIFSTRNPLYIVDWLIKYNLRQYVSNITNIKEPAFVYIDDRAIKFDGNYSKTLIELENFKPHWKN